MIEITIKVSNDEKTLKKKILVDSGEVILKREDPFIQSIVKEAVNEFHDPVEDVILLCRMTL